jgi:hypothetical protein
MIYEHGSVVGRLAIHSLNVLPSPDGKRIAVQDNHRIVMYDADGTLRWEVVNTLDRWMVWRGDDLIVNAQMSLFTLDPDTGAIKQRVCGWGFGLSALPHRDLTEGESFCDTR